LFCLQSIDAKSRLDTIEKINKELVTMKTKFMEDDKHFKDVYLYAFTFSKEKDSKVLG